MRFVSFILNLPWTAVALLLALISLPSSLMVNRCPFALVVRIRSYWWKAWLKSQKGVRASALGSVVMLGPTADDRDLVHELVHIGQFQKAPFVQPFLNIYELMRHGYRQNKYEQEAYCLSGSRYIE